MDPRLNFVTLAVRDLAAARRFYLQGLGWQAELDGDGVLMVRMSPTLVLSLWAEEEFEAEVGPVSRGEGLAPITLAHNVPTPADVDRVLADAAAAGASVVSPGQARDWGGYSGYFADPDGIRWEVAHNPSPLGEELMASSDLSPSADEARPTEARTSRGRSGKAESVGTLTDAPQP